MPLMNPQRSLKFFFFFTSIRKYSIHFLSDLFFTFLVSVSHMKQNNFTICGKYLVEGFYFILYFLMWEDIILQSYLADVIHPTPTIQLDQHWLNTLSSE